MKPCRAHAYSERHCDRHRLTQCRVIPEAELRNLLQQQGFAIANTSYRLLEDDRFQYRMVIRTGRIDNVARLTELWRQHPEVREFCISPTGD